MISSDERLECIAELERELNSAIDKGLWQSWEPGKKWRIIEMVSQWLKTSNPYFMDYAFELVCEWNAPICPTIQSEMLNASFARRDGRDRGTWKTVTRWIWKERTFILMKNLTLQGVALNDAAAKAASWVRVASGGTYTPKASTLDKRFGKEIRSKGIEAEFHRKQKQLNESRKVEWQCDWSEAIRSIPNLPDDMKGERR